MNRSTTKDKVRYYNYAYASTNTSGSRLRNIYIRVFSIIANNSALSFKSKEKRNELTERGKTHT